MQALGPESCGLVQRLARGARQAGAAGIGQRRRVRSGLVLWERQAVASDPQVVLMGNMQLALADEILAAVEVGHRLRLVG